MQFRNFNHTRLCNTLKNNFQTQCCHFLTAFPPALVLGRNERKELFMAEDEKKEGYAQFQKRICEEESERKNERFEIQSLWSSREKMLYNIVMLYNYTKYFRLKKKSTELDVGPLV
eukprot:TRINITY_DN2759_c0_g1_i1.p1 TRINITY_DN2759_c0_g1~~TRINITY_DN2759_c0_g1_i1.p1  ORF type:complete len:116 (-),score=21.54 TRINITY_DN2759_c0_g1_i1:31-378(-)